MKHFQIEHFFGPGLHLICQLGIDLKKLVIDPRNLQWKNYADPNLLPAPDPLEDYVTGHEGAIKMNGNNVAGNCVIAAKYNQDGVMAENAGNPCIYDPDAAIKDYSAITGYDPTQTQSDGSNPTDKGTDPQTAAKWYNALDPSDPRYIRAWVQIDPNNMTEVRQALKIFGGIWTAFALPLTAQDQLQAKEPWDYVKWPTPRRIAGSLGGHMVGTQLIDARQPKITGKVNTWGMVYPFTQAFWNHYAIMGIVYITNYWISQNTGKTPSGFDLDGLLADQKLVQAN